ncbi:hypothetical protein KAW64_12920 [bacterium]|nr:hypothetical protein [bacterium]
MQAIWKWEIPVDRMSAFGLDVPLGAKFLTCQLQGNTPVFWALVDPEATMLRREFRVAGTGHHHSWLAGWEYIGTFQLSGGAFIGHLFAEVD